MTRTKMIRGTTQTMNALRYADRHNLLELLEKCEVMRPSEVQQALNLKRSEASKILTALLDAKVVRRKKKNRRTSYYTLDKARMAAIDQALAVLSERRA